MNTKDYFFYGMIIVVFALSVYAFLWIRSENYKCVTNPLVYGVNNLQASTPVTCTCSAQGSNIQLFVTKDNATFINLRQDIPKNSSLIDYDKLFGK